MSIKLAFSNIACSELDLDGLIARSKEWGYAGVELKYFEGRFDLTAAPSLKRDAATIRSKFEDAGQKLVALNTSLAFCDRDARKVAAHRDKVRETIELAGRIGAEQVIVAGDVLPAGMSRARAISQTASVLRELAVPAAEHGVTIVVENIGDFAGSREMWLLHDAVRFPSVRVCWNQAYARMVGERPSISIPRLGHAFSMVHLTDVRYTEDGLIDAYVDAGKGQLEMERMVELLKGVAYDDWICVEWPRLWQPSLAAPEKVLPAYSKFLTEIISRKPVVLSAYKGDKNAPRFVSRPEPAGA